MKKFIIKLAQFLIMLAVLVIPFNVWADPYNVFHADNIRDNGVEPNKNYIKTRYILEHKEEYDSYLFGSSRAGFIDVSGLPDGNWYNFSYSEGLPREQYETLKTLIEQGEVPKQVYLSVDNIAFLVDPACHKGELYRQAFPYHGSAAEKLRFYTSYLDTITTMEALSIVKGYEGDTAGLQQRMYSTGCEKLNLDITFNGEHAEAYWADYYEPRIDEAIADIALIVELCEEYDIALTVFTNPIYITTYERSVEKGYLEFLMQLAEVTPYYNFSGYNRISMNNEYYFETSHFRPEAGDIIMDIVANGGNDEEIYGQGFGWYVTPESLDGFKEIIYHQVYTTGILEYVGE
ncbi:MAG: hypothetical protein IJZ44_06620 [Lachnospiraceae bacterium]|nr:hypothetical protein [Lachnospiraceae bacterium]